MKRQLRIAAVVIACSLPAVYGWAMGPGGACPTAQGGAGQAPMQALMTLDSTLQLSAEQQEAWDEFVATVSMRRAEMMGSMAAGAAADAASAPALLRNNAATLEMRVGMIRKMADALEKLYGKLTPEQQAMIDRTIAGHQQGHNG